LYISLFRKFTDGLKFECANGFIEEIGENDIIPYPNSMENDQRKVNKAAVSGRKVSD